MLRHNERQCITLHTPPPVPATHTTTSTRSTLGTRYVECNVLQLAATRCNTQHTTHNTLQSTCLEYKAHQDYDWYSRQVDCNALQRAATRCNTLQHTRHVTTNTLYTLGR